ncbi:MAG: AMP-binding protein [Kiritimatiellaeota bacterium]|nr:AMP-binding protein [Kiritimatiellota bacterium]
MTIRSFFEDAVTQSPQLPAQKFFEGNKWVSRSYASLKERVIRAAVVLRHLNLQPGRQNVALMMENCPEWQEIYLALAGSGLAVVPLDPKLRANEVCHILRDSEAVAIFAGTRLRNVIEQAVAGLPSLASCVWVGEGSGMVEAVKGRVSCAYEAVTNCAAAAYEAAREWFEGHTPDEHSIASIVYTSGTTGKPKGAVLTHGNFTANVLSTLERITFYANENFLNVLPLFHSFSFTANFMVPLRIKACCSFARSVKTMGEDMRVLQPTILFAVPLMAEKIYRRITEKMNGSVVARLLPRIGLKSIVRKKVRATFGGKLRFLGIGGAASDVEVLRGFQSIGIPVLEGYGLTECSPGVAYSDLDDYIPGTVGRIIPGMEYKIINKDNTGAGELCVKGPNVMRGYYKNAEATAEIIDADGFFHTGDLVHLDEHGNIRICGRRKALIVNREGKNIYPEEIEQVIERCPLVQDVIVLGYHGAGETSERVGAIIVPKEDAVADEEAIREAVSALCRKHLADYKLPRKIVFRKDALERTSTMKVRRVTYAGTLDEN